MSDPTSMTDLQQLAELVRTTAGEELLPRFEHSTRDYKPDGSVVTEADLAMQARLRAELAARWPGIALLGEEMEAAEQQRLIAGDAPLWILDPLDGTSNYASGVPFFAVSLALLVNGRVRQGVIYDPVRDELFTATRGGGAFLNGRRLRPQPAPPFSRCIAIIDYKRLPAALATRLATQPPFGSQRSLGSVALEGCWIAAGRGQLYLHGRQQLWDYAAAQLILAEAGGITTTMDGEPVFKRALEHRSSVAAMDHQRFREWCDWLGLPTPQSPIPV